MLPSLAQKVVKSKAAARSLTRNRATHISRQSGGVSATPTRHLSNTSVVAARPSRPSSITKEERHLLRSKRKERAAQVVQQQQQLQNSGGNTTASASAATGATTTSATTTVGLVSKYRWYLVSGGLLIPIGLAVWAVNDEDSPPAQFSKWIGLSNFVGGYFEEFSKPSHDKLLPDWSELPNVPHDIPTPHTLVLDLENTLVGSHWDRKYGWRHAKRPGVDKFLHDMAQYYEIVLYSPSYEGTAAPVVDALDKEGCIMHRLYREATHYHDGVHVKDLNRLNRNVNRMVVLDDDPAEVQFNPGNLIRIKPYTDPADRTDDSLARITPFLIEIAREGYSDIPKLLQQYQGMDSDEIANEQDRRLNRLKQQRDEIRQRGLGSLARGAAQALMEAPELPPSANMLVTSGQQLTAKDIAGSAPQASAGEGSGLVGFLNRRAKEKEENQMRKMEKWSEVMAKKQKEKEKAAKAAQNA